MFNEVTNLCIVFIKIVVNILTNLFFCISISIFIKLTLNLNKEFIVQRFISNESCEAYAMVEIL